MIDCFELNIMNENYLFGSAVSELILTLFIYTDDVKNVALFV